MKSAGNIQRGRKTPLGPMFTGIVCLSMLLLGLYMLRTVVVPHPSAMAPSNSPSPSPRRSQAKPSKDVHVQQSPSQSEPPSSISVPSADIPLELGLAPPPHVPVSVVAAYPHDTQAFTQGLAFYKGQLYESTGLNGASTLRKVDLTTGEVVRRYDLPSDHFGEGMTIWRERVYYITWRTRTCFVFDLNFSLKKIFNYDTEGWGLTHDANHLIMSDGSDKLYFRSTKNFATVKTLTVKEPNGNGGYNTIPMLNELEYIDGMIYANVWMSRRIAVISPETGIVQKWLSFGEDLHQTSRGEDVMNGIAFDPRSRRLFITGKWWPKMYEVEVPYLREE